MGKILLRPKSYSKRLNKVSDFVGNRRGFMRSFGIFLGKQSANVIKGLLPNYQRVDQKDER